MNSHEKRVMLAAYQKTEAAQGMKKKPKWATFEEWLADFDKDDEGNLIDWKELWEEARK